MPQMLAPVLLAVASGLAIIAYRHPDAYSKLLWGFRAMLAFMLVSSVFWQIGSSGTANALLPLLDPSKHAAAVATSANLGWIYAIEIPITVGAWLYIEFLGVMPVLLGLKKPE